MIYDDELTLNDRTQMLWDEVLDAEPIAAESVEDIKAAQKTLRRKLGFINFKDDVLRKVAVENWDADGNGEITFNRLRDKTGFIDGVQWVDTLKLYVTFVI